ncbi:MAG TPA: galactokinase, partial [Steroidobacteraceae bacterium]|nr:galactokinase [Steroidobacteraceae bacterium]
MRSFSDVFGHAPEVRAQAPGRVNLLGEHTDYNDGFVLPTTIPQLTRVELAKSRDGQFRFYSANLDESVEYKDGQTVPDGYARYVFGCIEVLKRRGERIAPVELHIRSDVPMGGGLSSSAALEVAVLRALREAFRIQIDDVELAKLAQQAEIEYAGVRCGILDQMATSLGDAKHMLFLDTRTLERKLLPLPSGAELVVIDSGIARTLATSGYNERRAQCEEAARLLGVKALRDETDPMRANSLPPPLDRRARHVITENARVLRAAQGVSAQEFGELMNASHTSLRDDYEVSIEGLDRLVELLQKQPDVFGARLTGAG